MPVKEMPPLEVPPAPEAEWFLKPSLGTWLSPRSPKEKDLPPAPPELPPAPPELPPAPPELPPAPPKLPAASEMPAKEMPPPEVPQAPEVEWLLRPSVGTWLSPPPVLLPAPPEPEVPTEPLTECTAEWCLRPSVGTWLCSAEAALAMQVLPEVAPEELAHSDRPSTAMWELGPSFLRPSVGTWFSSAENKVPPAQMPAEVASAELAFPEADLAEETAAEVPVPPVVPQEKPAKDLPQAAPEMPAKEMPPPEVPQAPEAPAKEMPPPPDVPEAPAKEMPPPEAPAKEMPPPPDVPEAPAKEMPPPEEAAPKAARPPSRPTPTVFSTAGDSILYAAKGILGKLPAEQTEEEELKSSREATDKLFKADFWGMESLNTPDAAEELAFARRYNELRPIATAEESAWQDPVHGRKWGSSRPSSSQVAASEPAPSRAATAPAAPPQPPRATKNDAGAADQEIQKSAPPQAPVEAAQRHWIFAEDDEETEMPSDDAPRLPAIESVSSPSTSVDFASRGSLLQRSKSSPIGREGSLLPELGDEASREDLKSRLALEIDLHMQTVDHVKELERKLRIANAAMKLPPGRRMPKRFGVSDARAYAVAPPAPERIPSPRRSKKAGGVYLPSIKPFPAQKSEERPQEKLEAIADKARAAALSPQQSRSTGFSKQEALVPAVKSAMRHERSQTRLEAISMLDSRGMNTWDVRKAEKVARFQDLNVFSESMWSSFHKWQDDATAPT